MSSDASSPSIGHLAVEPSPWDESIVVAAATGLVEEVQKELDKGVNVNDYDREFGKTALSWAAEREHAHILQLLLEHDADLECLEPTHGRTPLLEAVANGRVAVARHLINAGASLETRDAMGETPLLLATREDRVLLVKLLLRKKADPNAKDLRSGQAALSRSAPNGNKPILSMLLDYNAATDITDDRGRKPLSWAIEQGHEEIASILAGYKPDVGPVGAVGNMTTRDPAEVSDDDPLAKAMLAEYTRKVKRILNHCTSLDLRDEHGKAVLWASKRGYYKITKILLDKGVAVNQEDKDGSTALSFAVDNGHTELVSLLLDCKADVNSREDEQTTPLMVAAMRGEAKAAADGHGAVIPLLFERGADLSARDENEQTAISLAAEHGHLGVVKMLLVRGISADNDETDQTPPGKALGHELDTEDFSIVKLLLTHGADPFSKVYHDNRSPLQLAVVNGHRDIVELFLKIKPRSRNWKQEYVRESICQAAICRMDDFLDLLFEHYDSEDHNTETPLQWVYSRTCSCETEVAASLLKPYLSPRADYGEMENNDTRGSL